MRATDEPKPAVNLRDLPREERGFLVPAEAPWVDGQPFVAQTEPLMKLVLAAFRACAVRGFPLPDEEPVWRIQDTSTRRNMKVETDDDGTVNTIDVPGHLVCMLYSALVCPFWRTPSARLGKESMYQPGAKRGDSPAIMGYADYALLIDPRRPLGGPNSQTFPLVYRGLWREIAFSDPLCDLADAYETERLRCGGRYVKPKRRHYAPQFGGRERLRREIDAVVAALQHREPEEVVSYDGVPVELHTAGWSR